MCQLIFELFLFFVDRIQVLNIILLKLQRLFYLLTRSFYIYLIRDQIEY